MMPRPEHEVQGVAEGNPLGRGWSLSFLFIASDDKVSTVSTHNENLKRLIVN